MRWFVLGALVVACVYAIVQNREPALEWRSMSGAEISAALTDQVVTYGDKWQDFRASGRTLYFSGRESWGYWEVRGDQYCSLWPPSDLWACYDMRTDGTDLQFVGAGGDITRAVYRQ